MKVYCTGVAVIEHKDTKVQYQIRAEDLDWQQVGGSERGMGAEYQYSADVEHPELGLLTWNIWEYPVGVENSKDVEAHGHEVVQDFEYGLEHENSFED